MLRGVAPGRRHNGDDFTEEDRQWRWPPGAILPHAALLQIRGDWEWLSQCFRFRSPSANHFCWRCDVARDGFLDFAPNAAHRATLIDHAAYLTRCAAERSEV